MVAASGSGFLYHIDRRGRYKYTCAAEYGTYVHALRHAPDFAITQCGNVLASLEGGHLVIQPGYASDGPSGPTIDTPDSIRAAFLHDVLCQAIAEGLLPRKYKRAADRLLRSAAREDGMPKWRYTLWYASVRAFGGAWAWWGRVRPRRRT